MTQIKRPSTEIIEALKNIGCDSVCSTLDALGVRRNIIEGPIARVPGSSIVGPALTLQFLPTREDRLPHFEVPDMSAQETKREVEGEESQEKTSALWAVLLETQPGDVIVVDARGDRTTGCFGEMLMTYFKAHGGAGVVIDAGIRDSRQIFEDLKVPVWSTSVSTAGASHMNMYPHAINVPIGCGKVLVNPGDIIMADDGGAIVVPPFLAPRIIEIAGARDYKEIFVRRKLQEGGDLMKYYPFNAQGQLEYDEWLAQQEKD